jgi:hypothetical protein
MTTYDGVLCKVVDEDEKGHLELEVIEAMPWNYAPEVGSRFWITPDDEYFGK